MIQNTHSDRFLVSSRVSKDIDAEAQAEWGFNAFSLVEAAGRSCAGVFADTFPAFFKSRCRVTVAAGGGNNGADAMAMLRFWILSGLVDSSNAALIVNRMPEKDETSPRSQILLSLRKMKVQLLVWDGDEGEKAGRASDDVLAHSDIIIDGIAGTGLKGALEGVLLEMVNAVNAHRKEVPLVRSGKRVSDKNPGKRPFIVSVDLPSGNSDEWESGMPIVEADITLAIEPEKSCVYTPASRSYAGTILPVGTVFPKEIVARHREIELLDWKRAGKRITGIRATVYKSERGTVEIRAGSPGATGAAFIAARGAQAAGAGLIRLVVDDEIYPILASQPGGIMVAPAGATVVDSRFPPDAVLLGPGWGVKPGRDLILGKALELEKAGTPLVLDADAIDLARGKMFSGNTILTPHPGEFSRFSGLTVKELLCRPMPVLNKIARQRNAVILFKGHVMIIAAPDGRLGIVDGMAPALATGGNGDLLAGFCAAIAARMVKESGAFDPYICAAAAAALLIASGKSEGFVRRFADPLELAGRAADLAGEAWLETPNGQNLEHFRD